MPVKPCGSPTLQSTFSKLEIPINLPAATSGFPKSPLQLLVVRVPFAQMKLFLDIKLCVFARHFCKSTVFNLMYCKVVGIVLSFLFGDIRPKPIVMTSVAGTVGDVANGMMYKDFENHTDFGSLIKAMSL